MINFTKKHFVIILLSLIILFGFYIRIEGVITNSFAFTYDVGRDMLQVNNIVVGNKLPLIGQTTGLGGLFYGPWWYYLLTPAFIITGGNPQGIAFFMVLIGLLTIYVGFLFGRYINGTRFGLLVAALISFSPIMVGYSVQIWNPNVAPLFTLVVLIALLKIKNNIKNWKWYLIIGFMLGLILDTEIVFGALFLISILLIYIWLERKKAFNTSLLAALVGFLFTLSPRMLFELRHNFIMTQTLLNPKPGAEGIFAVNNFFTDIPGRALTFFMQYRDTFSPGNTIVAIIFLGITVSVIVWKRKHIKDKSLFCLMIICTVLTVFLFGTSFFARAIWGHYLVGLPILYILSFALILDILWKKWKYPSIILLIVASYFMLNPVGRIYNASQPLWEGNAAVYRNQVAVIDYIYSQADGRGFNEIVYTPSVHDFPYQYLFSWYGKNKYGYVPSVKTEKLLYVVIEPDPGYESRIIEWLKIREGDGKIIKEETVKGGIKVQTRMR